MTIAKGTDKTATPHGVLGDSSQSERDAPLAVRAVGIVAEAVRDRLCRQTGIDPKRFSAIKWWSIQRDAEISVATVLAMVRADMLAIADEWETPFGPDAAVARALADRIAPVDARARVVAEEIADEVAAWSRRQAGLDMDRIEAVRNARAGGGS